LPRQRERCRSGGSLFTLKKRSEHDWYLPGLSRNGEDCKGRVKKGAGKKKTSQQQGKGREPDPAEKKKDRYNCYGVGAENFGQEE